MGAACYVWIGLKAPRFQDIRHMKVVRLSALRTGRLYPQDHTMNFSYQFICAQKHLNIQILF